MENKRLCEKEEDEQYARLLAIFSQHTRLLSRFRVRFIVLAKENVLYARAANSQTRVRP